VTWSLGKPNWWWPWVLLRMGLGDAVMDELGRWVLKDRIDMVPVMEFKIEQNLPKMEGLRLTLQTCRMHWKLSSLKDTLWGLPGSKITMSWKSAIIVWFLLAGVHYHVSSLSFVGSKTKEKPHDFQQVTWLRVCVINVPIDKKRLKPWTEDKRRRYWTITLLGTYMSPFQGTFEDDVPFPQVPGWYMLVFLDGIFSIHDKSCDLLGSLWYSLVIEPIGANISPVELKVFVPDS